MIPTYEKQEAMASGNFGTVWRIKMNNDEYAMKVVPQDENYINREEDIMKQLKHDNIVRYVNSWVNECKLYIIMECVPTSIYEYIKTNTISSENVKKVTHDIFSGLEYLHSKSICHRDLKPANLLYDPTLVKVKICDFGCSKVLEDDKPSASYICSRYYRAPELILGAKVYTTAIDMWSAACVIAEITSKKTLFRGFDSINHQLAQIIKTLGLPSTYQCVKMGVKTFRFTGEIKCRKLADVLYESTQFELIHLLSKILVYDPDKRLTASQALEHDYYNNMGMLEECVKQIREDFASNEENKIDKIEERVRRLYEMMNDKHAIDLEHQEKANTAQYQKFINSPNEKGQRKWTSPVAGVFSRVKNT